MALLHREPTRVCRAVGSVDGPEVGVPAPYLVLACKPGRVSQYNGDGRLDGEIVAGLLKGAWPACQSMRALGYIWWTCGR